MLDLLLSLLLQLALLNGGTLEQKDDKKSTNTATTFSTTTENTGSTTTTTTGTSGTETGSGDSNRGGSGTWETKN